jgi:hypothetical protein
MREMSGAIGKRGVARTRLRVAALRLVWRGARGFKARRSFRSEPLCQGLLLTFAQASLGANSFHIAKRAATQIAQLLASSDKEMRKIGPSPKGCDGNRAALCCRLRPGMAKVFVLPRVWSDLHSQRRLRESQ